MRTDPPSPETFLLASATYPQASSTFPQASAPFPQASATCLFLKLLRFFLKLLHLLLELLQLFHKLLLLFLALQRLVLKRLQLSSGLDCAPEFTAFRQPDPRPGWISGRSVTPGPSIASLASASTGRVSSLLFDVIIKSAAIFPRVHFPSM